MRKYDEKRASGLVAALRQLVDLYTGAGVYADEYDADFRSPSGVAFDLAWQVIAEAYPRTRSEPGQPVIAPIGDGGISIRWLKEDREVALTIPPAGSPVAYLYHRDGSGDNVDQDLSPENVARWFDWLADPSGHVAVSPAAR